MLLILVSVPLLGSLVILMINSQRHLNLIKQVALITTVVTFIISIIIWGQFDNSITGYQFVSEYNNTNFGHLILGLDGLSLYFVLLTTFIIPFCILANWENIQNNIKMYFISFLAIESFLIIAFIVLDLILFYIFFEAVLIPIFLVVGIWGGANRQRAAMLLFLYTLGGSLFILLSIMSIYYITGSTDFNVLLVSNFSTNVQYLLWLGFFISFAIKTPIIPIHQWLPRAHAEAPLAGSILLASVLLKLAAYGCLRILINYIPDATLYFTPLVQSIAIISLIYSSLATLRQVDFKVLVAYSSIGHIAIVILGLFSNTIIGIEGAIALSIAHGLISPAIFALVGGCLYDRIHTRIIRYYRGITLYMPVFSLLFFIASAFNIAVPLSLNYIGEFLSLAGVFQQSPIIGLLGASSIFLSACYTIYLFNRIAYGSYSKFITFTLDINRREFIVIIPLLLITLVLGVYPSIIFNDIHLSVSHIIYSPPA